jgi:hypothetical protein
MRSHVPAAGFAALITRAADCGVDLSRWLDALVQDESKPMILYSDRQSDRQTLEVALTVRMQIEGRPLPAPAAGTDDPRPEVFKPSASEITGIFTDARFFCTAAGPFDTKDVALPSGVHVVDILKIREHAKTVCRQHIDERLGGLLNRASLVQAHLEQSLKEAAERRQFAPLRDLKRIFKCQSSTGEKFEASDEEVGCFLAKTWENNADWPQMNLHRLLEFCSAQLARIWGNDVKKAIQRAAQSGQSLEQALQARTMTEPLISQKELEIVLNVGFRKGWKSDFRLENHEMVNIVHRFAHRGDGGGDGVGGADHSVHIEVGKFLRFSQEQEADYTDRVIQAMVYRALSAGVCIGRPAEGLGLGGQPLSVEEGSNSRNLTASQLKRMLGVRGPRYFRATDGEIGCIVASRRFQPSNAHKRSRGGSVGMASSSMGSPVAAGCERAKFVDFLATEAVELELLEYMFRTSVERVVQARLRKAHTGAAPSIAAATTMVRQFVMEIRSKLLEESHSSGAVDALGGGAAARRRRTAKATTFDAAAVANCGGVLVDLPLLKALFDATGLHLPSRPEYMDVLMRRIGGGTVSSTLEGTADANSGATVTLDRFVAFVRKRRFGQGAGVEGKLQHFVMPRATGAGDAVEPGYEGEVAVMFRRLDDSGHGSFTAVEIREIFLSRGLSLPPKVMHRFIELLVGYFEKQVEGLFAGGPAAGNGELNYEDFAAFIRPYKKYNGDKHSAASEDERQKLKWGSCFRVSVLTPFNYFELALSPDDTMVQLRQMISHKLFWQQHSVQGAAGYEGSKQLGAGFKIFRHYGTVPAVYEPLDSVGHVLRHGESLVVVDPSNKQPGASDDTAVFEFQGPIDFDPLHSFIEDRCIRGPLETTWVVALEFLDHYNKHSRLRLNMAQLRKLLTQTKADELKHEEYGCVQYREVRTPLQTIGCFRGIKLAKGPAVKGKQSSKTAVAHAERIDEGKLHGVLGQANVLLERQLRKEQADSKPAAQRAGGEGGGMAGAEVTETMRVRALPLRLQELSKRRTAAQQKKKVEKKEQEKAEKAGEKQRKKRAYVENQQKRVDGAEKKKVEEDLRRREDELKRKEKEQKEREEWLKEEEKRRKMLRERQLQEEKEDREHEDREKNQWEEEDRLDQGAGGNDGDLSPTTDPANRSPEIALHPRSPLFDYTEWQGGEQEEEKEREEEEQEQEQERDSEQEYRMQSKKRELSSHFYGQGGCSRLSVASSNGRQSTFTAAAADAGVEEVVGLVQGALQQLVDGLIRLHAADASNNENAEHTEVMDALTVFGLFPRAAGSADEGSTAREVREAAGAAPARGGGGACWERLSRNDFEKGLETVLNVRLSWVQLDGLLTKMARRLSRHGRGRSEGVTAAEFVSAFGDEGDYLYTSGRDGSSGKRTKRRGKDKHMKRKGGGGVSLVGRQAQEQRAQDQGALQQLVELLTAELNSKRDVADRLREFERPLRKVDERKANKCCSEARQEVKRPLGDRLESALQKMERIEARRGSMGEERGHTLVFIDQMLSDLKGQVQDIDVLIKEVEARCRDAA